MTSAESVLQAVHQEDIQHCGAPTTSSECKFNPVKIIQCFDVSHAFLSDCCLVSLSLFLHNNELLTVIHNLSNLIIFPLLSSVDLYCCSNVKLTNFGSHNLAAALSSRSVNLDT